MCLPKKAFVPPFNYESIDAAFQSLCKILFGGPVGSMKGFEPYLKEAMLPYMIVKSSVSGKDVYLSNHMYPKAALFVAPDEAGKLKSKPVGISDIKDIDSLFRAASENMVYCGNKVFGKNVNVELVDNALNCIDVYFSHNVRNVKRGAFLSYVRESEYVFGIPAFPKINYSMRCHEGINANRMFEAFYTTHSSDMYYSFNCTNCTEVIFGFNLRGKRHVIGNLELAPEKYAALKKKLMGELAGMLVKNKRAPSISDIASLGAKKQIEDGEAVFIPTLPAPAGVEKAFSETTGIVFGSGRGPIKDYVPWLQERALPVKKVRGRFGTRTFKPDMPLVKDIPGSSLCTFQEAIRENKPIVSESDLALSFSEIAAKVAPKAAFTMDFVDGACSDYVEVSQVIASTDVYSSWDATSSKHSACSSAIIQSQYIFGGYFRALDSEFCVNCYDVVEAKRCLEVDSSSRSVSCYFCHNIEGCEDCIFCCNVKGMRHAVFNQQLPRDEYLRVKKMLLDYVNGQLDAKRRIDRSVFALK